MTEPDRKKRNEQMLAECHEGFRSRVCRVLALVEAKGFRPRIQCAHRSIADQLKAFNSGNSKVKFGFHNVTGPNGEKEALAVDVLDDDNPKVPTIQYLVALGQAAREMGLTTGITWGLPSQMRKVLEAKVIRGDITGIDPLKIGWDPTHIEPIMKVAAAKAGDRPAPYILGQRPGILKPGGQSNA